MEKYFDGGDNTPNDEESAETPQEETVTKPIHKTVHHHTAKKPVRRKR
jgi:hypothetical protein